MIDIHLIKIKKTGKLGIFVCPLPVFFLLNTNYFGNITFILQESLTRLYIVNC